MAHPTRRVGRPRTARVRAGLAAALLVPALALAGCSGGNSVADQARDGSGKGYVAGDGTIEKVPAARRGEPVRLQGNLLDGSAWSMQDAAGKVLVVNVWGSWCEPCEREAPHLVSAARALTKGDEVAFLGIDVGEEASTGLAAQQRLGLPYPSLSDRDRASGAALQNKATATPTTLVLDRRGRIAARISGAITTPSTLTGLVQDVVAEDA